MMTSCIFQSPSDFQEPTVAAFLAYFIDFVFEVPRLNDWCLVTLLRTVIFLGYLHGAQIRFCFILFSIRVIAVPVVVMIVSFAFQEIC